MIVHIQNPFEGKKTETIAQQMVGKRTFIGWPFLREGMVIAVSDSLFKYEKVAFGDGKQTRVLSNPHAPQGIQHWKGKAERIESIYSKRMGVITGQVDVLLHVRPLKGECRHADRVDTGAFVKDYEGNDKEVEQAVQMAISDVASEDPRYVEKDAPPLNEEFPEGCKVFFLGEPAYGVAAQVSATDETTLSVILAFFPTEKAENDKFKGAVSSRVTGKYIPSFAVAEKLGMSGHALSKITSSFMVLSSDNQKTNLGLSLKFEAKALKVIGYSRKNDRYWEFSDTAIDLIREYKEKYPELFRKLGGPGDQMAKASEVFPDNPDAKLKEVKAWLNSKGVRDLEAVSLFCDQLDKGTVSEIEKLADEFRANKTSDGIKKAIVKGIPRQAILKPSHTVYRLQNQSFALGDRVVMVQDSGSVPLAVKGVVIGLNTNTMDVVWDVPFLSGTTLGDRCSPYRGSQVEFNTCLNLTRPQFVTSTDPKAEHKSPQNPAFRPRFGPHPSIQPAQGQAPAAGFRPAPNRGGPPMRIMTNPNRGRGGYPNGHQVWVNGNANGGHQQHPAQPRPQVDGTNNHAPAHRQVDGHTTQGDQPMQNRRGHPTRGAGPQNSTTGTARGGFYRGRGGFTPNLDRGRGSHPGRGFRGRGGQISSVAPAS
ncbi:hypothetical protein BD410DRAFT_726523 [Rickenella mellea]|uniref:Uncharacterized protein n=1 Tax=Rickenella mellea TaxID=50990 RepID=A0A4Y7PY28_9AGAM|nr:hypothetical protein BD410DRAFT_726523 [Rickenella mellea]